MTAASRFLGSMRASSPEVWVALRMIPGVTLRLYTRLVDRFGDPGAVLAAPIAALAAAGAPAAVARAIASGRSRDEAARELERAGRAGARIVTRADADYPAALREIADPPPYLYVRGALVAGDDPAVAVVGSRAASSYGREVAAILARDLAAAGVTVVSGLAHGVDAAAHGGALAGGGRTIAVLGCGIDVVYPREHDRLAEAIAGQGAVVSELFMGTPPLPQHFPVRNRIVSGLARGTVVVEAAERSGSLITARCALEQGREVFAVPGSIMAPRSRGANLLLQRGGAKLVTAATDVLEEIGLAVRSQRPAGARAPAAVTAEMGDAARCLVGALVDGGADAEELVARTGLTAPEVLRMLLELELAGIVCQLPGGMYSLPPEARGPVGIAQSLVESGA